MSPSRSRASLSLFGPIRAARASDAIVDQLVDLITTGRLGVGQRLPGERALAEAMDVSRGTVRDAVGRLAAAGVLSVAPGPAGGIAVASIWVPDALLVDPAPLEPGAALALLEARRTIELRVAQLAGERGTAEDHRVMRETIELQRASLDDQTRLAQGNDRFHRQLWRAAGNPELEAAMRSIYRRLGGLFAAALAGDLERERGLVGVELHEETLAAVVDGDPERIAEVMDRHLAYLERRCAVVVGGTSPRPLVPGDVTA